VAWGALERRAMGGRWVGALCVPVVAAAVVVAAVALGAPSRRSRTSTSRSFPYPRHLGFTTNDHYNHTKNAVKYYHQACCDTNIYGDAVKRILSFRGPPLNLTLIMNPDVFGRSSLPSPNYVFSCITGDSRYGNRELFTFSGDCNLFGCNCDHCYGDSNCKGTDDAPWQAKSAERQKVYWDYPWFQHAEHGDTDCPEAAPYLACPSSSGRRRHLAEDGETTAASVGALEGSVSCSDKNLVLSEPLNVTAARLTSVFCEPGGGGEVGLSFAGQALDTLDANNDGSVNCVEWKIAKRQATAKELVASGVQGYFGPAKLDPPNCKMSASGKAELAKYNAYLALLTLETAAANTTAWAVSGARGAALAVEGRLVGNAAAGVAVTATEGLLAALNRTASG